MQPDHDDNAETYVTPPKLARRLGIHHDKILRLIDSGQLSAINMALTTGGRPRWRIAESEVQRFLRSRASSPKPTRTRRTRRPDPSTTTYF
jgi:excisionase family DNA binding protein